MKTLKYTALLTAFVLLAGGLVRAQSNSDCFTCHASPETCARKTVSNDAFQSSVHKKLNCTDCHGDIKELPHPDKLQKVSCNTCHEEQYKSFQQSIHSLKSAEGDTDVPVCQSCHGSHEIKGPEDYESNTFRTKSAELCKKCHTDSKLIERHPDMPHAEIFKAYDNSIHGKSVQKGISYSATCTDCHGHHLILPHKDPKSTINHANIPATCGTCHKGIYDIYAKSVHGVDAARGNPDVPVCTDCHGEHTIAIHNDPEKGTTKLNTVKKCSACHGKKEIIEKYNLPGNRVKTFLDSYHGAGTEYGNESAATCADCHGFHNIQPSAQAQSSVNPKNLPETCGKCHKNAGPGFAQGKVHQDAGGKLIVRQFYIWFTSILAALFIIHIMMDIVRRKKKTNENKT